MRASNKSNTGKLIIIEVYVSPFVSNILDLADTHTNNPQYLRALNILHSACAHTERSL